MRIGVVTAMALALTAGVADARAPSTPDRVLAGRTPGKPVDCISQTQVFDTQTFDDGSIYYRMAGPVDYLNRPYQCSQLRSDRAYSTRTPGTQLCRGDILNVFDAAAHFPYGSCSFGDFVPYPKLKKH
jgi:hypothetical protein